MKIEVVSAPIQISKQLIEHIQDAARIVKEKLNFINIMDEVNKGLKMCVWW